ncbi:hypothetical protein [Hwangdonia seohaensis]|uniref:Uncharacterized protein n=1 Tax=Hwangdonia seohaensis TaxID=1240727 RepID=A0ABW3RAV1_9FLAO|nr:hypothetical protein [Hwangdonia seohaensis]
MEEQQPEEQTTDKFEEKFEKFIETANGEITSLKTELNDITELYNDFVKKPSTAVLSKAEKLNETFEKVNEYSSEIAQIETKVQEFETKVFGKTTEDTESLKFKLNDLKTQHEELNGEWEGNFETLSYKIEGLLPGATSAGLAKSYYDQKRSYKTPNVIWSAVFTLTMIGMVYYAIQTVNDSSDIGNAFMNILSRAPFFIPTIWLALFASKQQSQNRRLEQEYAYKESLAKSYDGYKREIEKLPESDEKNEIMEKLIRSMVDAAGFNPSSTLEKVSHNDKPPILGNWFGRKEEIKK